MPTALSVAGQGACPAAPSVARALERLHPRLRADAADGVRVEVVDRGARYEVRAGGATRVIEDAERRCGERATAAAVAVTLLLDPPSAPPPDEPAGPLAPRESPPAAALPATPPPARAMATPPPARAIATPRPPPPASAPSTLAVLAPRRAARRPSRIDLELTGVLGGAPALGSAAPELTGGGALRLALGGRYVAATVGFAGLAPADATAANVAVRVVRIPFDAGVRLAIPLGRVEPGVDAGLAFAILQLSAPALTDATTSTRLDVGARIAPFLRIGLTARLALVFGLEMIVSFAPYDLVVDPNSTRIATTPRLWLAGGLGLAARL